MKKIAVFASGSGSDFQSVIDANERDPFCEIALLVASKEGIFALERAKKHGIPSAVCSARSFASAQAFGEHLVGLLSARGVDYIVLAGYLSMVPEALIRSYPDRIINIHPSLIPSFCGKGYYGINVHRAAIEYGVKVSGLTVHFVDEHYDNGAIILQRTVPSSTATLPKRCRRASSRRSTGRSPRPSACSTTGKLRQGGAARSPSQTEPARRGSLALRGEKGRRGGIFPRPRVQNCGRGVRRIGGKNLSKTGVTPMNVYSLFPTSENSSATTATSAAASSSARARTAKRPSSPTSSWVGAKTAATAYFHARKGTTVTIYPVRCESKVEDPSLIIYSPVRRVGRQRRRHQRRPDGHRLRLSARRARPSRRRCKTRCFEPDAPNFTPRISGILHVCGQGTSPTNSASLKSADEQGTACNRYTFSATQPLPGVGHFIHTYNCDGNPIPTFTGEPERVRIPRRRPRLRRDPVGQSQREQQDLAVRPLHRPRDGRVARACSSIKISKRKVKEDTAMNEFRAQIRLQPQPESPPEHLHGGRLLTSPSKS